MMHEEDTNRINTIYEYIEGSMEKQWMEKIKKTTIFNVGRFLVPISLIGIFISWILAFSYDDIAKRFAHPINVLSILIFTILTLGPFTQSKLIWFGPFYFVPVPNNNRSMEALKLSLYAVFIIFAFTSPVAAGISIQSVNAREFMDVIYATFMFIIPTVFLSSVTTTDDYNEKGNVESFLPTYEETKNIDYKPLKKSSWKRIFPVL